MDRPIITLDFETDPFSHGHKPYAFCAGVYTGSVFFHRWSRSCVREIVSDLSRLEPSVIYMHNGGKFDIIGYLMQFLNKGKMSTNEVLDATDCEMRIINGRIVEAKMGHHLVRDSFAILPMALKAMGEKLEIDIDKLNRDRREENKDEILTYLKQDCVGLHKHVTDFIEEFGEFLTIGSAAMSQLRKFHPFDKGNKYLDEKFRKQFFFGGRVQCFRPSGVYNLPFKIYDVNSMYPYVMKTMEHPTGTQYELDRVIRKNTNFVVVEGKQLGPYGAFPIRNRQGGIDFTIERGTFTPTIHEFNAAIDCGYFRPTKILKTYSFNATISFAEFIDHFYAARLKAKAEKDRIHEIFYKFILNSAYGKFAQNPESFFDWAITRNERLPEPWKEHYIFKGHHVIWRKRIQRHSYFNVAIGASITGAARAVIMRGIRACKEPVYCDTDSIIGRDLSSSSVTIDKTVLGAWKIEGTGDRIAIAGKKLYCCWNGTEVIKQATKGSKLNADEILEIANGGTVTYRNQAPTFGLNGSVKFIKRKIKATV